jgi:hypothetical protein
VLVLEVDLDLEAVALQAEGPRSRGAESGRDGSSEDREQQAEGEDDGQAAEHGGTS